HTGAGAELGKSAGRPPAVQRAGVLLVDLPAGAGHRAVLCRIPRPCERIARGCSDGEDRRETWRGPIMRQERTVYLHRWIRSELLLTFAALFLSATPTAAQQTRSNPESLIVPGEIGRTG